MLHSDDFWWTADYVIRYNIKSCKTQKKTYNYLVLKKIKIK